MLIAIYHGFDDTLDLTDLCPGNSMHDGSNFGNITNAPLAAGSSHRLR